MPSLPFSLAQTLPPLERRATWYHLPVSAARRRDGRQKTAEPTKKEKKMVDQGKLLRDPENIRRLTDGKVIVAYVRKGASDNERRVGFARPENIPVGELLKRGIAIDGNQALFSVSGSRVNPWDGKDGQPLTYEWPRFDPLPE